MGDFVVFTDSTTDLPVGYAKELELEIINFTYTIDGKEYSNHLDHRELSTQEFYVLLKEGKIATTSLITADRFVKTFEPFIKGGKDILYLCFSSGASGSYSQAVVAADELAETYPGSKLIVIDSLCASMGQGLLAHYAVTEKRKGRTIGEVADYIRKLVPSLAHWVTVDDLVHLKRGGRVSGATAIVGSLLGIKPIIHLDDEGRLIPVDKVRGRQKSLEYLAEKMRETIVEPKNQIVFISHGNSPEDAAKLADLIKKKIGTETFIINDIGPVIGAHSGPGTIALFFIASKR